MDAGVDAATVTSVDDVVDAGVDNAAVASVDVAVDAGGDIAAVTSVDGAVEAGVKSVVGGAVVVSIVFSIASPTRW